MRWNFRSMYRTRISRQQRRNTSKRGVPCATTAPTIIRP